MVHLRSLTFFVLACLLEHNSGSLIAKAALVKEVACPNPPAKFNTKVRLTPGNSFSLNCSGYDTAIPRNFHTAACSGNGAACTEPSLYSKLFPAASNHVFVTPSDENLSTVHTWTSPLEDKLGKTPVVFSVGCSKKEGANNNICYVDVEVTSEASTLHVVSIAALAQFAIATFFSS